MIVVLIAGKPLAMPWVKENADAVLVQWYAGEQQGCTLADIIGEWFTNYVPVTVAGSQLFGNWVLDFILALMIGVYFLARAFKADFFSLLSWQVGMYGWMAIVYFVLFINEPLPKDTWIFWFMMQLAMLFGFFCAYPMNALLIKLGIKKGM